MSRCNQVPFELHHAQTNMHFTFDFMEQTRVRLRGPPELLLPYSPNQLTVTLLDNESEGIWLTGFPAEPS